MRAASLHFIGQDTLFSRYWGTSIDMKFLHYEVSYYQVIEFAIEHQLSYINGGAGGKHKLARGFLPQYTYHAHQTNHLLLKATLEELTQKKQKHFIELYQTENNRSPFKIPE